MTGVPVTEVYPSNFMTLNYSFEEIKASTIHELGHFFGLYHIFRGGCINNSGIDECYGDQISTTPFCDIGITGYTGPEDCSIIFLTCNNEIYPLNNYMSYFVFCFKEFVSEQFDRMGMFLSAYEMYTQSSLEWTLYQGNQPSDYSGNVTINSNISGGTKVVSDNSILTKNGNVTFNNLNFLMGANSKIVVPGGSSLIINGGSTFEVS
ncbi:MAG: hypothetical protein ACI86M_001215 [Saprospiraceae bacterium]|jgi:hypothetical protein